VSGFQTDQAESDGRGSRRIARILSDVFQPILLGTYVLIMVGLASADSVPAGLAWGFGSALLTAGVPTLEILRRMRRSTVDDFHIIAREQRLGPLLVALTCTALAFALSAALHAPHPVQTSLLAALVNGIVLTIVTGAWKVSFHSATASSSLVLIVWTLGPWSLLLAPLVPAVAWSRVRLGRHTPTQVVVGGVVGLALTLMVLALYRPR
jgi:membrane-associated phospholipid phosphatase